MKLPLKIVLGLAGLALALAVALAVAVAVLFDPKDYQPLLVDSVSKATGRKFTLDGDLGLDFLPCCAVTLGGAALGNPPGFPEGEFARVEQAALSLKVWPLIARREVEIGTVRLDGLKANLLVRRDGAANWEFDAAAAGEETSGKPGVAAGQLAIEGIEIRNGRIAYRDEEDPADYLAEDFSLDTGDITPGDPFDLKLSTKVTDQADGTTGTVTVAANATVDADFTQLALAKPQIDLAASGEAIPAKSLAAWLEPAALLVEFRQDTHFRFSGLQGDFRLPGLEAAAGDAEGNFNAGDTSIAFGPSTELVVPQLQADITINGKDIPGERITARVRTEKISLDVDKLWGSVEALTANVTGLGARAVIAGRGRVAKSGASLAGTFELDPVSPRSLLAVLKQSAPQTADPQALTRLSGKAAWAFAKEALKLSKLDFQLDETRLTGDLGITDFDKPLTRFDLALDAIDLDRYLAPEVEAASGSPAGGAPAEAEDIPVETIRDLRIDGRLRIGQLTFARAKLASVSVGVNAADGRLRLDPLSADLYGGEYRGAVSIDATGPVAKLAVEQKLTALQVGSVLKDLYQNDKLTGALTGSISATGTGNGSNALLRTLDGSVAVSIADGAYLGTDLWHEIRSARARLRGDAPPPAPEKPQTRFNALELAGRVSDGVLDTDKLLAEIPFTRLTGEGGLNLVDRTLDYRLQAQVFETPTFADGSSIKDLNGLTIPLTLKGALDKPKVGVDLKNMAAGAATRKLKERLLKKLGEEEPAGEGSGTDAQPAADQQAPADQPAAEPKPKEKPRDILKRGLRDLLKQ
jgi:AsmA protein